jgi:hypothetical protein
MISLCVVEFMAHNLILSILERMTIHKSKLMYFTSMVQSNGVTGMSFFSNINHFQPTVLLRKILFNLLRTCLK